MSMKIGIVGLPNVGKSTLFKALTKKQVDISNYPFCTIEPNIGVVAVPDERLEKISEIIKPEKIILPVIEFVDIAGLVKNAHKGEGLGNQFLSHIKEVDIICQVVRCFKDEKITHIYGEINPQKDIEIVNLELIMKDLETLRKYSGKERVKAKKLEEWLENEKLITDLEDKKEYQEIIKELQLLTAKPIIYVLNSKNDCPSLSIKPCLELDIKLEEELSELTPEEAKELQMPSSKLDQLIKICYDMLNLVTFYTIVGGKEARAWSISQGTKIIEAAGKIHTDFSQKFIKAEVINWQKLIEINSSPTSPSQCWLQARKNGQIRIEGKDYIVQDGDVIEIKI